MQSFKQKEPSDSDGSEDGEEDRQELQTSTAHSKGVAKSREQRAPLVSARRRNANGLQQSAAVQAPQLTSTPPWHLFFRMSTYI